MYVQGVSTRKVKAITEEPFPYLILDARYEKVREGGIVASQAVLIQRCYVHFLRNALDHLPRKADDDCMKELRWIYDRRDLEEARRDLAAWLTKWQSKYPKLCDWVEQAIEETLRFYRLPLVHHKHLESTNMLERLNVE